MDRDGFAPSQMSIELASEVITAEEAANLVEFRKVCKGFLKDINGMIQRVALFPPSSKTLPPISVPRTHMAVIADALRIRGYCVTVGEMEGDHQNYILSIAW